MNEMIIAAPAKVNLTLRVLGKRDDGFHELETLMLPIAGLADELKISSGSKYELVCDRKDIPTGESNLVTKAVRAFEQKTGRNCHYKIELTKHVPHGAGLGGGSSDAASVLLALNQLENTKLSKGELAEIAAQFGSDTAFFIYQQACWCCGRGEKVEPVDVKLEGAIVLYKPSFSIATPEVFSRWRGASEIPDVPYQAQKFSWGELVNDLEKPAFEKYIMLADMKRWLLEKPQVKGALMSGSGSTMFALLENIEVGEKFVSEIQSEFGEGEICLTTKLA